MPDYWPWVLLGLGVLAIVRWVAIRMIGRAARSREEQRARDAVAGRYRV